jgi:tetraprenyl-beta-curcumene synthase
MREQIPASLTNGHRDRPPVAALGDRRLVAQVGLALVLANVRYWTSVAPIVRREMRRWEQRAQAIHDDELRMLALEKLRGEGFHAEAAAMLATLAPRSHRRDLVEAIVALELLFDYLDGLTERPSEDPLREGERLFEALTDAVVVPAAGTGKNLQRPPRSDDGGYLEILSRTVSDALARLPAALAITEVAQRTAVRSGQAQTRMHAAAALGTEQVEEWARREAKGTGLQWRELLAGAASSVLVMHALIAAAADPSTTPEEAGEIESAYLSTCTVLTLLDGLADHDQDTQTLGMETRGVEDREDSSPPTRPLTPGGVGETDGTGGLSDADSSPSGICSLGYLSFYDDPEELSQTLTAAAQRAVAQTRALPNGPHHAMTLVGVVAYYTSHPGARGKLAAPIVKRLQAELEPLISPTLALMRGWRLAKEMRAGNRRAPRGRGLASSLEKSCGIGGVQ